MLFPPERRVLLNVATARDASMASAVLERAGIDAHVCSGMAELIGEFEHGAGALFIAEETLVEPALSHLLQALADQGPWSDVPVLVLARHGADSGAIARAMEGMPGATVIERPVRIASLVSALRSTLRARERQYELRNLLANLHEADQRKTQFLATLAHELRNPLAPLTAALALLASGRLGNGEVVQYHDMMRRQLGHMTRLVDDLMEVSRITRGKVVLQHMPLALATVIDDAMEVSRPWMEAAGHTLTVQALDRSIAVQGDRVRLTQVFANLLNNAAKYTRPGGHITVVVRREGDTGVVEVMDDGTGLAPDMLRPIFDMFVQVAGTAKIAQGGLGIGLTLVKSLVELHGGSVVAQSGGLDLGSTFVVTLPLLHDAVPDVSHGAAWTPPAAAALERSVLVVDDNRDVADSLAALLRALGARVFVAYDARQALQLAASRPIDNAVLDIGMPEFDGCELARRLRAAPATAHMTLVAVTGWGQEDDRRRIRDAGFDHHLLKPVDAKELLGLLSASSPSRQRTTADTPSPLKAH